MASISMYNKSGRWLAAAGWAGLLIVGSTVSTRGLPKINLWMDLIGPDKIAHALAYGIFSVLLFRAVAAKTTAAAAGLAFGSAALFGAGMEGWQAIINTGRTYDVADMVANAVGAALGLFVFYCSKVFFGGRSRS